MGKLTDDTVFDAALDNLKNNVTRMVLMSGQPANFAAANTGGADNLADVTLAGTDFTHANGDVSGRKTTVGAKSTVLVDVTGTANHVGLLDVVNSIVKHVSTVTAQAVTAGNNVNFPAWDIEFNDPT